MLPGLIVHPTYPAAKAELPSDAVLPPTKPSIPYPFTKIVEPGRCYLN